jgi:hypothetical protein
MHQHARLTLPRPSPAAPAHPLLDGVHLQMGNRALALALGSDDALGHLVRRALVEEAAGLPTRLPWDSNQQMLARIGELREPGGADDGGADDDAWGDDGWTDGDGALPPAVRARIESAFGDDLAPVRLPSDPAFARLDDDLLAELARP